MDKRHVRNTIKNLFSDDARAFYRLSILFIPLALVSFSVYILFDFRVALIIGVGCTLGAAIFLFSAVSYGYTGQVEATKIGGLSGSARPGAHYRARGPDKHSPKLAQDLKAYDFRPLSEDAIEQTSDGFRIENRVFKHFQDARKYLDNVNAKRAEMRRKLKSR